MCNTIRLTILNRAEEIEIMKLVGATDQFVMGPFLLEGMLLGSIASILAIFLLHVLVNVLMVNLAIYFPFFPYAVDLKRVIMVYVIMFGWGSLLSFLGALISTRSTLKRYYKGEIFAKFFRDNAAVIGWQLLYFLHTMFAGSLFLGDKIVGMLKLQSNKIQTLRLLETMD